MGLWSDLFRVFSLAFSQDPLGRDGNARDISGAGITQPDAIPDIRQDGNYYGDRAGIRLRDSNEFIDLSSVTNRISRYKEYERLRNVAEIEMTMTVFADEACLGANTKIATLNDGFVTIKWLAENRKDEPFLVYCWDFARNDYTIGYAYDPRLVGTKETVRINLDNGDFFVATPDHRVLLRDGTWKQAGELGRGDKLMAFYRLRSPAECDVSFYTKKPLKNFKTNQFPRIFTYQQGWVNERQFLDEWRHNNWGKNEEYNRVNQAVRLLTSGLSIRQTEKVIGRDWHQVWKWMKADGWSTKECKILANREDARTVMAVTPGKPVEVYDLSVQDHQNFCGESCVFHNCQRGDNGHKFNISCSNKQVEEELEFLFFHRKMLNMDERIWRNAKNLFIYGDLFWELVIDHNNPNDGILKIQELPPESVYRIETTKGRLVEFQQSKDGPDYMALTRAPITQATDADILQTKAIRFTPEQVVHIKIGDDRRTFYPYGTSLIEAARGSANQLRLIEDALVVYRLSRSPERRIFYIDVAQLPPYKAEAFLDRMKDQFRKKKVASQRGHQTSGASGVDERWHTPAIDEDYWLPIRPNSNTRVETLPGAQNLGEVDDAMYFRNKLFLALNFPKNYFNSEDVQATRIALSAQDIKFARLIERLQNHIEEGIWTVADRHLKLRGFPASSYEDLQIRMTPPSEWRELSRAEVVNNRINNASAVKGSQLMSDKDILVYWLKFDQEEADKVVSRNKLQKLEDLKIQILAQNPQLLGVGIPGSGGTEIGAETGGPSPMLPPPDAASQPDESGGQDQPTAEPAPEPQKSRGQPLPEPSEDEVKKYDLEIKSYASEIDREEQTF
jgi:hypothetical protein